LAKIFAKTLQTKTFDTFSEKLLKTKGLTKMDSKFFEQKFTEQK
jgi:hypothetical protein